MQNPIHELTNTQCQHYTIWIHFTSNCNYRKFCAITSQIIMGVYIGEIFRDQTPKWFRSPQIIKNTYIINSRNPEIQKPKVFSGYVSANNFPAESLNLHAYGVCTGLQHNSLSAICKYMLCNIWRGSNCMAWLVCRVLVMISTGTMQKRCWWDSKGLVRDLG